MNEGIIKEELGGMVRQNIEDTLNVLLEEDADHLTYGKRYERTSPRKNTRAGHDNMKLTKTAKKVEGSVVETLEYTHFKKTLEEDSKQQCHRTIIVKYFLHLANHRQPKSAVST